MSEEWRENLIPLVGPYDAEDLWFLTGLPGLATWLLLWAAPRWKYTHDLALCLPILISFIYAAGIVTSISAETGDGGMKNFENTLAFVYNLFRDPNAVFLGWIHYIAYDILVGRAISLDAIAIELPYYRLVLAPVLFLSLMVGPMGLFVYLMIRTVWVTFLKSKSNKKKGR